MDFMGICPSCGKSLESDRIWDGLVVCECGWTHSRERGAERAVQRKQIKIFGVIGAAVVLSFFQAVNWDSHFFEIIPLKAKQAVGMASMTDLQKIADICMERKKFDCAEKADFQIYSKNPAGELAILPKLGHLQFERKEYDRVVKTLTPYFAGHGRSGDAAYDMARALVQTGRAKASISYFHIAEKSKPKVFQVNVSRDYVLALMQTGNWHRAEVMVNYYRGRSATSSMFMNDQYKQIKKHVQARRIANW